MNKRLKLISIIFFSSLILVGCNINNKAKIKLEKQEIISDNEKEFRKVEYVKEQMEKVESSAVEAEIKSSLNNKAVFIRGKILKVLPPPRTIIENMPPRFLIENNNKEVFSVINQLQLDVKKDDEVIVKGMMFGAEEDEYPTIFSIIIRHLK